MSEKVVTHVKCTKCGNAIESCAFCDEPDCRAAICYQCVGIVLQQAKRRPHNQGG